ncbi:adhesin, partial [Bartonella tribocorum]
TEAVNGSQLYETNDKVANYFGGGAKYENGEWTAPSFKIVSFKDDGSSEETSYDNVAAAFAGMNTSFTKLHHDLSDNIEQNALLWSDNDNAFVATHGTEGDKKNSKITSLANGSVTKDSTDAVNGGQLYSMNNTLASYFGGGAKYENGEWSAPSFKVHAVSEDGSKVEEKSYDDVAKAFASVGSSFSNLHNEVTNAVKNINNQIDQVVSDSLVKQDDVSKVIKIGAEKEGAAISIANSDGASRSLSGVKAATLSAVSTEAVNGSQLYETNDKVANYFGGGAKYENGEWTAPSFKIVSFKDDGSSEETSYDNVAAAFAGMNTSFTKLHHDLSDNIEQNAL